MGKGRAEADAERLGRLGEATNELLALTSETRPTPVAALWADHLRIRALLRNVAELQDPAPLHPPDFCRATHLPAFLEWASKNGISTMGIMVEQESGIGGDQFGLRAMEEVSAGVEVVSVPRRAMLCWDRARSCAALKAGMEADPILSGMHNVALAVFLLHERLKGPDSHFRPYLDFLPATYATPLFFTEEEMGGLKGSPAFEVAYNFANQTQTESTFQAALSIFRSISRQFAYFLHRFTLGNSNPLLKSSMTARNFSFDAYKWAVATVSTRINFVPSKILEDTLIPALIPYLDLANHQAGSLTTNYQTESDAAVTTTDKAYKPGQPVCIFYGARTTRDFLLHGGFVPRGLNADDDMCVRLGLSRKDKLGDLRRRLLGRAVKEPQKEEFRIRKINPIIEEDMLNWVRVFVATEEGLTAAVEAGDLFTLAKDQANERRLWSYIKSRCELLIGGYSGARWDESTLSPVQLSILQLIQTERQLLKGAADYAAAKLAKLMPAA